MARVKSFDEKKALRKAMEVFWEQGYNATSIQDLVDRMGINRASIYDTYGDKHELFLAALNAYQEEESQRLFDFLQNNPVTLDTLRQLLEYQIQGKADQSHNLGCFMVNTTVELYGCDQKVRECISQNNADLHSALSQFVETLQQNGELSGRHSAGSVADYLMMTVVGLKVMSMSANDPERLQKIVDQIIEGLQA
jgi:TetR/AcrR family transcriptional repressor of nem operon